MTPRQQAFLQSIGNRIPQLLKAVADGNDRAELILGTRTLGGRQVRLVLLVEVIDPGANPLETHSSRRQPQTQTG